MTLEDGKVISADLVLAADGAFSRVRESLLLTSRIDYLDEGYIRLPVPRREDDPPAEITEYWNESRRLLYDPCTEDMNYVCLCCSVDDEAGRRTPIDKSDWLRWFPPLSDLIERFPDEGRWDRAMRVTCRSWSSGRAAVVGDAAHAQPPNLGQGANLSFQNALSLAVYLDQSEDVPTARATWEREQRPLSDHVQRWTHMYGRVASAWPQRWVRHRSSVLERVTNVRWVDNQLNKAARHVPSVPFEGSAPTSTPDGVELATRASRYQSLGRRLPTPD
ncbi:MAG: hypothetical protein QOF07_2733 [Bradyrhizobium sp.]|nr:hypothetical protein [Bradyrhizobium sp.]